MSTTLNANISLNDVFAQLASEQENAQRAAKKPTTFDTKNYLQAKLTPKETTKTLVIRLLPFSAEGGTPFHKVFMHQVKVNKEVSESGWKSFPCPVHNQTGDKCPFCDTSQKAKELKFESNSEIEKKRFGEIEFSNKAKEQWVVRCIERGHEEDGVKFWMFSHSKKGDGVFNKIMNIAKVRYETSKLQGKETNIFDVNEGKDLIITLTKDSQGKTVVNVTDADDKTPLSQDFNQANEWINDTKSWTEVYTTKSYDYMSVIVSGGTPVFSKEQKCYVDKNEAIAENKAKQEAELQANLTEPTEDLSVVSDKMIMDDDDDDLPF